MRHVPVPTLAALLLCAALPASGDDRLFIRPWVELEPIVRIEDEYPIPLEKAGQWVLEEARALLSGMVYGWTFTWTPGDVARKVEDRFDLVPVAEIPWGSERLAVRQTQVEEARLFAQVSYQMTPAEELRRQSWAGAVVDAATGTGECPGPGRPGRQADRAEQRGQGRGPQLPAHPHPEQAARDPGRNRALGGPPGLGGVGRLSRGGEDPPARARRRSL